MTNDYREVAPEWGNEGQDLLESKVKGKTVEEVIKNMAPLSHPYLAVPSEKKPVKPLPKDDKLSAPIQKYSILPQIGIDLEDNNEDTATKRALECVFLILIVTTLFGAYLVIKSFV